MNETPDTRPPPPPTYRPAPPAPVPRPLAAISAIVGFAGLVGFFGPAIVWPVPAALGIIAIGLALYANHVERSIGVVGLILGSLALVAAGIGYSEWQEMLDTLGSFGS